MKVKKEICGVVIAMEQTSILDLPKADDDSSTEEKIHDEQVKNFNNKFPKLDQLMSSVLLKCPQELLDKLMDDPDMWKTAPPSSTHLFGNVTVSDAEPEQRPVSPTSVLEK